MSGSSSIVRWLPGATRIAPWHRAAGQQFDHLCAVHWAAILLRSDGIAVTPEALAIDAGTTVPGDGPEVLPPGAVSRPVRTGTVPVAPRADASGTSAFGLADAVSRASAGARALVPLRAPWDPGWVRSVIDLCVDAPHWEAVPLANVRTGMLWGSRLPLLDVVAWLDGGRVDAPAPDWDVGHFVSIAGWLEGTSRSLVIVRDSYPGLGWDGHHLQPPEVLGAALSRGDGREGGVALYVSEADRAEVERAAKEVGFAIGSWDNGTPWPGAGTEGGAGG
jgi:hypothetical protein